MMDYLRLARLHSPFGSLLLLWPTLWGLFIAADGAPNAKWIAIFILGTITMRSFGCAVNDIADRRLDAAVARTRERPLAAGRISVAEAAIVAAVFLAASICLWWQLPIAAKLWSLAAVAVAVIYPLTKRFFFLPQAALGVAFGCGILVAAAVYHPAPPPIAWAFFAANFFWVMAYDTIYAMADAQDDAAFGGVFSSALWFGKRAAAAVSLCYVAAILILSAIGVVAGYGVAYQVALIAAMALVFRFYRLYRRADPAACMAAFRANHLFGALVLLGIIAAYF